MRFESELTSILIAFGRLKGFSAISALAEKETRNPTKSFIMTGSLLLDILLLAFLLLAGLLFFFTSIHAVISVLKLRISSRNKLKPIVRIGMLLFTLITLHMGVLVDTIKLPRCFCSWVREKPTRILLSVDIFAESLYLTGVESGVWSVRIGP